MQETLAFVDALNAAFDAAVACSAGQCESRCERHWREYDAAVSRYAWIEDASVASAAQIRGPSAERAAVAARAILVLVDQDDGRPALHILGRRRGRDGRHRVANATAHWLVLFLD